MVGSSEEHSHQMDGSAAEWESQRLTRRSSERDTRVRSFNFIVWAPLIAGRLSLCSNILNQYAHRSTGRHFSLR